MNNHLARLRSQSARLVAVALVLALYQFAQLPQLAGGERAELAGHFQFERQPLPTLSGGAPRSVRMVNPSLQRIASWISSVGAAVALNDLDGDGLSNDVCHVDPRFDQVIVSPVPGTTARFTPFALNPAPLPFNPATTAPMGCLPGDFNEDGQVDLLVYYWGRTPIAFLHRDSRGGGQPGPLTRADYLPREVAATGERWYSNAATTADLDGDGHLDIVIGNYFPDGARILDAAAGDKETMQHSMSRAENGGRNRLLRWTGATAGNEPTVQFDDVDALDGKLAHGWTLAVGAEDLDGDLLPELYFANDFGPDRLLYNRSTPGRLRFTLLHGEKELTTPNSKVLGNDSFKGMGVDFGDLNGDGLPDIYVSNIAATYALEESHFLFLSTGEPEKMRDGIAPYVDKSEELGLSRSSWAWEARLGDFDNDGVLEALQATGFVRGQTNRWPELHELAMGNDEVLSDPSSWPQFQPGVDISGHEHLRFFVRASDGRYYDLAHDLHLDDMQVSRGIATADVDGDGDLDFVVANQWQTSYVYLNQTPQANAFLGLHLRLAQKSSKTEEVSVTSGHPSSGVPSSPAVGATATVYLPNGRRLVSQSDGGNGHSGKRSPDLLFGLGHAPAATPLRVDLHWRDRNGHVMSTTLYLQPGWHTVMLGS